MSQVKDVCFENHGAINVSDDTLDNWNTNMSKLRFSKFAHPYCKDGIVALYHSLTHDVLYLDKRIHDLVTEKIGSKILPQESTIFCELIKHGLLVSSNFNEDAIINKIRKRFLGKPSIGILYLLLTDICNLKCKYCFIENAIPENHAFTLMDEKIALNGIKYFAELLKKNPVDRKIEKPQIIFYGGEPLLNQSVFLASLNEITKLKNTGLLPENTAIILLTNGTKINQKILKAIIKNKVSVSLSLDGHSKEHDANRIFLNGKGTYKRVMASLKKLKEAGANVCISCTVSPDNVDRLVPIFNWLIHNLKFKNLGFNMLLDLPQFSQTNQEYMEQVTNKLIECYKIARLYGVYEDRIMRKVKTFVKKNLYLADCGGYGNQIVISPTGKIGPCHAYASTLENFSGDIKSMEFNPYNDPIFVQWSKRSPFNISECLNCEAIGICGGGCAYNASLKTGDIWKVDTNFCIHSKKILEWLIWDLYQKTVERR